jgi:hypothetical protein
MGGLSKMENIKLAELPSAPCGRTVARLLRDPSNDQSW